VSSVEMSRDVEAVRISNVLDVHVTVVDGGGLADKAVLFNSEVADVCCGLAGSPCKLNGLHPIFHLFLSPIASHHVKVVF